jgi:hypothetical protein
MGRVATARDQRVEAFRRGPDEPATRLQPWPSGSDGEEALGRALAAADVALAAAEESHWHVLAVFEKTLGPNHPQVATMHRRLADLHQGMGRRARAESHLRTALAVRTAALGTLRPPPTPLPSACSWPPTDGRPKRNRSCGTRWPRSGAPSGRTARRSRSSPRRWGPWPWTAWWPPVVASS